MQFGSPGESFAENARDLPSGDQEREFPYSYKEKNPEVAEYNLRSGPPRLGTMKILICVPDCLTNARYLPSGDHAGYMSSAGFVVSLNGGVPVSLSFT
jgi:hypothetical protein